MLPRDSFRDYSVSIEQCSRILKHASLPPPRSIERIQRGEVNACFSVKLEDNRQLILKVQFRRQFPASLLREQEACLRLAQTPGIQVPTVIAVDTAKQTLPLNYSILTALPGDDGDVAWPQFPPDRQRDVFRQLGRTLARIHAANLSCESSPSALPTKRSPEDWLNHQRRAFETLFQNHSQLTYLPPWLLERIKEFWAARWEFMLQCKRVFLLHGDYELRNVKLTPPSHLIAGVFDFDQTDVGHPEFDFSPLNAGVFSSRPDLKDAFYEGYSECAQLAPGYDQRIELYTLLRHLQIMLSYEGPRRSNDGTGSSAEAIARLVAATHAGAAAVTSKFGGLMQPAAVSDPPQEIHDPDQIDAITGEYLARVLSKGLNLPVAVTYWHRQHTPSWQAFQGRSTAQAHAFQLALKIHNAPTRDMALVLKLTPSRREAMFYSTLSSLLTPNVPKAYHVVVRPHGDLHWLFLEYVPCMVLGPLWEGHEFEKAIQGMVAIHSRFWRKPQLLRSHTWLPYVGPEGLLTGFRSDLELLAAAGEIAASDPLRRRISLLLQIAASSAARASLTADSLAAQPYTLLHGDYHLANVGTRRLSIDDPPVITDWASCGLGPPQVDLAYFLDAVQGLTREKPHPDALTQLYLSKLASAGLSLPSQDSFAHALQAATFFNDIHRLPALIQNRDWEASWRGDIYYSVEDELALRTERAIHRLTSNSP